MEDRQRIPGLGIRAVTGTGRQTNGHHQCAVLSNEVGRAGTSISRDRVDGRCRRRDGVDQHNFIAVERSRGIRHLDEHIEIVQNTIVVDVDPHTCRVRTICRLEDIIREPVIGT